MEVKARGQDSRITMPLHVMVQLIDLPVSSTPDEMCTVATRRLGWIAFNATYVEYKP